MHSPFLVEVDLGDEGFSFDLSSPITPIRFTQHAPGSDFWRAALALDSLTRSDLRAMLQVACYSGISASEIGRLMLPKNREPVLAGLSEAVQIAIDALETSKQIN